MLALALTAALVGAVLGLRFKVLVLVPAIAIFVALIAAASLALAIGPWRALIAVVVATIALQIGFLGGSGTRLFVAGGRTWAARRPSAAASRPAH
jgi:hypothetical protein